MIWDPYHITWDPYYIFDCDHDNHHSYSMAITINKISFIPVCENDDDIQNGEDGDGAIGDIIQPARWER